MPDRGAEGRRPAVISALVAGGAIALLCAALAWRAIDVMVAAFAAVPFPLSLDYGEGIVVQQALMMLTPSAYGDITTMPFIVFHYPPVYHLAVRAAAAWGADIVSAARLVSIGGAMLAAGAVGALAAAVLGRSLPRGVRVFGAASAAAAVLLPAPTANWVPMARVDMLAMGLTFAGLALAASAGGSRRRLAVAVLLLVLAVFTKQTTVAAPIAVVGVLLLTDRRAGIFAALLGLGLGAALLGLCQWLTAGRFVEHTVLYNINRYDVAYLRRMLAVTQWYPVLFVASVVGIALRLARQKAGSGHRAASAPLWMAVLHVGISTAMLPMAGKSGAGPYYLIEWFCGLAVLTGVAFGEIAWRVRGGAGGATPRLALVSCVLALTGLGLVASLPDPRHALIRDASTTNRVAQEAIARVVASGGDIIADDMILNLRAGRPVLWEPAIFAELASHGRWDESRIIEAIRDGRFAMAVTDGDAGGQRFDPRYRPAVAAAMQAAWPVRLQVGWLTFHLPPE